ncbi:MAG: C40 family peptidase [Bacteroidia bacterium]|nr:C40 family peptidase [Bacteroidia bacterium]
MLKNTWKQSLRFFAGLVLFCLTQGSEALFAQELQYAICLQDVVPVRGATADSGEQVTQLLFGDAFKVLKASSDQSWIYIENSYDQYQGWIRRNQAHPISETYYEAYLIQHHPLADGQPGQASWPEDTVAVPLGSTLPFYEEGFIRVNNQKIAYEGKVRWAEKSVPSHQVLTDARRFLSSPYLWGGKSPQGVDCSGFTQMVYKMNGISIPRDSYQQAEKGKEITLADISPVIWFSSARARSRMPGLFT